MSDKLKERLAEVVALKEKYSGMIGSDACLNYLKRTEYYEVSQPRLAKMINDAIGDVPYVATVDRLFGLGRVLEHATHELLSALEDEDDGVRSLDCGPDFPYDEFEEIYEAFTYLSPGWCDMTNFIGGVVSNHVSQEILEVLGDGSVNAYVGALMFSGRSDERGYIPVRPEDACEIGIDLFRKANAASVVSDTQFAIFVYGYFPSIFGPAEARVRELVEPDIEYARRSVDRWSGDRETGVEFARRRALADLVESVPGRIVREKVEYVFGLRRVVLDAVLGDYLRGIPEQSVDAFIQKCDAVHARAEEEYARAKEKLGELERNLGPIKPTKRRILDFNSPQARLNLARRTVLAIGRDFDAARLVRLFARSERTYTAQAIQDYLSECD